VKTHSLALLLALLPVLAWSHAGDERGLQRLQQLIEQRPQQQSHYIKRGALYTRAGHFQLALADFERAQTLGPIAAVSFELGLYYFRRQQMSDAAEQFDLHLAHYDNDAAALEFRIKTARALGQQPLAQDLFETLVTQSPYSNPGHYLAAANAEIKGEAGLARALVLIDRGIARFGPVPQLQQFAIELELRRGDYQQAISRHQTLATATGHSPHWLAKQAQLLAGDQRTEEAAKLVRRAQMALSTQTNTPARARLNKQLAELLAAIDSH